MSSTNLFAGIGDIPALPPPVPSKEQEPETAVPPAKLPDDNINLFDGIGASPVRTAAPPPTSSTPNDSATNLFSDIGTNKPVAALAEDDEPFYSHAWGWAKGAAGWTTDPTLHPETWDITKGVENETTDVLGTGTAGKVALGVEHGVANLIEGLSSPLNIAITVGTLGSGAALEALGVAAREIPTAIKGLKTLMDLGFSGQQVYGVVTNFPKVLDSLKDGDYETASQLTTGIIAAGGLLSMSAKQLGKDAGHLAEDFGVTKPSEQQVLARKLAGIYDSSVAQAGGRADQLMKALDEKLKDAGIDKDEVRMGAIRKYMLANGDRNLLQAQHDALAGKLKVRAQTPEELETAKMGAELKKWNEGNKLVDAEGKPVIAYHGTMSPTPIKDWEAGPPTTKEGEDIIPSSGDPNAYLGPHFAIGDNARKVANKFATGEGDAWLATRKSVMPQASPAVYPVHLKITKLKDFGTEQNLNDFIYQNGYIHDEELLNEAMRSGPGTFEPFDPSVLEEANPDSPAYKKTESLANLWDKKYNSDAQFRGEVNAWIMRQPPSNFGFEDDTILNQEAQSLGNSAREALRGYGFDGIQYKNEVEGGHAVVPIGEKLNEQIRSAPASARAVSNAFSREFVYHATDVSRSENIKNSGIRGNEKRPGQYTNTPEEAMRSGAVGVGGRKDLRVFAVPREEVEAASTPLLDDLGRQGQEAGKYLGSKATHLPSHEILLDEKGNPTGQVIPLRPDSDIKLPTIENARFQAHTQEEKDAILAPYKAAIGGLSPKEIDIANYLREFYEDQMDNAHGRGLIRHAVENYHPQAWAKDQPPSFLKRIFGTPIRPEENKAMNRLYHETNNGNFDTNVAAAKKRVFETEFQGEMAGMKPRTADLKYHMGNYQFQLEKALAARDFLDSLRDRAVTSSDGVSPLVAMRGSSKIVGEQVLNPKTNELEDNRALLMNPNSVRGVRIKDSIIENLEQTGQLQDLMQSGKINQLPFTVERVNKETGEIEHRPTYAWDSTGYESVGRHGRDWIYTGQDTNGNPAFLKAEMVAHPEAADYIRQVLGEDKSAVRASTLGRSVLGVSKEGKGLLLGMSPFHATQLSLRSLMLGQLPTLKPIDFLDPLIQKGIENNLTFETWRAKDEFNLGFRAHSKILGSIPGLRNVQNYIEDFTFNRLMPSLKAQAFKAKFADFRERMPGSSVDEVARHTADYINDTFGGQNWRELGASATHQDLMRATALAPDWLLSEIRSLARLGGAMGKPAGQVARADMTKFVAGAYITARVLNLLATGKTHPEAPFGVVKPGKNGQDDTVYSLRTLPGDLAHAISSPREFVAGRVNPMVIRPAMEFISGRDEKGRKVTPGTQVGDFLKNVVPIGAQATLKSALGQATDLSNSDQVLKAMGASVYKYRTEAENLAMQKASDHMPSGPVSPINLANHMRNLRLEDGLRTGAISRGQVYRDLPKREAEEIIKMSKMTPLQARFERLPLADAVDVWELATSSEKDLLHKQLWKKRVNYLKEHNPRERATDPTWAKAQKTFDNMMQ